MLVTCKYDNTPHEKTSGCKDWEEANVKGKAKAKKVSDDAYRSFRLQIDARQAVADFYLVLMAEPLFNPVTTHHARLEMFQRIKSRVIGPLARAFFDYIVAVCAGELRHGGHACAMHYAGYPQSGVTSRVDSTVFALKYEPKELLQAASRLFKEYHWNSSYGGSSWGRIADAGLLYKTVPDIVFIDHAVDLSHNAGNFLDKDIIFKMNSESRYQTMLNSKRDAKTPKEFIDTLVVTNTPISSDVLPLVTRLYGADTIAAKLNPAPAWNYEEVAWGKDLFDLELLEREDDDSDGEETSKEETPQAPEIVPADDRSEGQ